MFNRTQVLTATLHLAIYTKPYAQHIYAYKLGIHEYYH